jgi:hypothetical protein
VQKSEDRAGNGANEDAATAIGWVASSPNWEPTAEEIRRSTEELADMYSRPGPKLPPLTETDRAARILPTAFVNPPYGYRTNSVRVLPADPWGWVKLAR